MAVCNVGFAPDLIRLATWVQFPPPLRYYRCDDLLARCKWLTKIVNYQNSKYDLHNLVTYDTINPKLKTAHKEIHNEK